MTSRDIRRKYGQNYLIDPAILFEMGEVISPNDSDNFIEIGPGKVLSGLIKRINRDVLVNTINNEEDIKNLKI